MNPPSQLQTQSSLRVFSTCPPSRDADPDSYAGTVRRVAELSDDAGYEGILVYTDNGLADPWLVASEILGSTERLAPLVALQPVYMHPFAAAKMVSTLSLLHERRIWLNLVAGGFKNDLIALNDPTPHDERYDRLVEYAGIMTALLRGETVTFEGRYYEVRGLKLLPALPEDRFPGILMSGSSDAGREAAEAIGALAVEYPKPPETYDADANGESGRGLRIGIIARPGAEEAWTVAYERFPGDRKGKLTHELAMKVSDSEWHKQLSDLAAERTGQHPYWLHPFEHYKTFCPYLVGAYEEIAEQIALYLSSGFQTFILDIPVDASDVQHTARAFELALEQS